MNLLVLMLALSAPVPSEVAKPKPATLAAGIYTLKLGTVDYTAVFEPNGTFGERCTDGCDWVGYWSYDDETRTLTVAETYNGIYWCRWGVQFGKELSGVNSMGIAFALRPFLPPRWNR